MIRSRSECLLEEHFSGALRAVCELMRRYGISKRAAERALKLAMDRGYSDSISDSRETRRFSRLADVCARWHCDREFVDAHGQPKPLRWNGRSGELLKLVNRVVGPKEAMQIADELISRRLLKKSSGGSWLPKSKVVAPLGSPHAEVLRAASMIERLLQTILHNRTLKYRGSVLLEVMAQVPRLPSGNIKSFKKFAKDQGVSFIKTIDDWLESRNVRVVGKKAASRTSEAGVVAYAFVQSVKRRPRRVSRS